MADDVLRMRATIVDEQALAAARRLAREIGAIGARGAPGLKVVNTELMTLSATLRRVGTEVRNVVPAMGGMGLGAAGVGLAMGGMIRTFTDVAKKIVELKYASKELGMSERDIRAWGTAAEKAGISSDSMREGLTNFKKTTDGLRYNIGGVRNELIALGAGSVVSRMQSATNQADKLREAFDFKDALMATDQTGFKARMFFDMIGLGSDKARLSLQEYQEAHAKTVALTPEQQAAAKKYADSLVDLGKAWDQLVIKAGVQVFPGLAQDFKDLEKLIGYLGQVDGFLESWLGKPQDVLPRMFGTGRFAAPPPTTGTADWMMPPGRAMGGPVGAGRPYIVGERGPELFMPSGSGSISNSFHERGGGGSSDDDASRIVQKGVFNALVDFSNYAGGGTGGVQKATFSPGEFGPNAGTGAGAASGGTSGGLGTGSPSGTTAPGAGPGGGTTKSGGPAQLNDEGGKPIDPQTMKQAEALGRAGDTAGLQKLFAQKGYRMSGPACGIVASAYVKSAGFKPPQGGGMASNWNDWAEKTDAAGINAPGRPFGSMIASYKERRYGGNVGAPLGKGQKGGHVMTIVPGTYDAKTDTAMFVDQYGAKRRNKVSGMDLRYAGDTAVAEVQRRRGEAQTVTGKPSGTTTPDGQPQGSQLPGTGGGQGYLQQQRAKFGKEFENNPALKEKIAALATLESEGDVSSVAESLFNRADYMGKSVAGAIAPNSKGKSFYGPLNNPGMVERRLEELRKDPARMKRAMAGIDKALAGSNEIDLYTDQGSGNDPNMIAGGTGVNRKGGRTVAPGTPGAERYNTFGGGPGGHRGAAAWRARQQAAMAEAERQRQNTASNRIDATVGPQQVQGRVAVTVNSNGTKADTDAKSEGPLFQPDQTTVTQHRQMAEPSLAMPVP